MTRLRHQWRLAALAATLALAIIVLVVLVVLPGPTVPATISLGGADAGVLHARASLQRQDAGFIRSALADAGANGATVSVGGPSGAPPVAPGFVGISVEINAIPDYAAQAPALGQLMANLDPGQRPVIRIGGDSTDHAWVPYPGRSGDGMPYVLDRPWLAAARRIAVAANARLAVGVNMEVDDPAVVAHEATALKAGLGPYLSALEAGNEPDLYSTFPWYVAPDGTKVFQHHKPGWVPALYVDELRRTRSAFGGLPVWGPSMAQASSWWRSLPQMASAVPTLSTISFHSYPVTCYVPSTSDRTISIPHLLDANSSTGLARQAGPELAFARAHHLGFRVDEINTVACAGRYAITGTAAALWAIEAGFAFARAGMDGVNLHTFPRAAYRLFAFHPTGAAASDEYYGWMLFARAAPPGSQILDTTVDGGAANVVAEAARTTTGTNVVLINPSSRHSALVALSAAGTRRAQIEALRGAGLAASGDVTYAGLSISPRTARLSGDPDLTVVESHGRYAIELPPGSADLVRLTN